MPGFLGRVGAGVLGGLVGGVAFGFLMQVTGALPVVASLVDQDSLAVGWGLHIGISVFIGVTFAGIFGVFAEGLLISMVLGVFYGIIWWVLGGLTLLPLRLGLGLFVFDSAAWQSLAGHVGYGLALGVVYALACYLLARRSAPDASRRLPPAASSSALAAGLPGFAGPAAFGGSAAFAGPGGLAGPGGFAAPAAFAAPHAFAGPSAFAADPPSDAWLPPATPLSPPSGPPPADSTSWFGAPTGQPPAAPSPAGAASLFAASAGEPAAAPPPPPVTRSRSGGLTPLPPEARELRQRGRRDR